MFACLPMVMCGLIAYSLICIAGHMERKQWDRFRDTLYFLVPNTSLPALNLCPHILPAPFQISKVMIVWIVSLSLIFRNPSRILKCS